MDIKHTIEEAIEIHNKLITDECISKIQSISDVITTAFLHKNKVLLCGNGGSAADAQHLSAELTGRFKKDRAPLDAEALHVNTSYMTAVANDYSYDEVYSRLILAKGRPGDVLIGLSTSGNSKNIVKAFEVAKFNKLITIAFTGQSQNNLERLSDIIIKVPSTDTARIQECHILLGHIVCGIVERELFG